ncbi:dolichyl-phosphate beta-glucosyltransferase [Acidobacteriota bacterium]
MGKQTKQSIRLSVIIPAYNEEQRIEECVRSTVEYLENQKLSFEVLVVDDGSRDRTPEICTGIHPAVTTLINDQNQGKGYSVKRGMLAARGEHVLFFDADLSTPIEEIGKLWKWFEKGFDIVIGSRSLPDSDIAIRQPWHRELMGKIFNLLVRVLVVPGITDTQCGFKCFSRPAVDVIFPRQTIHRWGFDPEILFIARKHGFKIKDIPVRWLNRSESRVSPVQASLRMFTDLFRVRLQNVTGKYK